MRERGLPAPFVEELASPGGELLKRFFEKIRADCFQVVAQEVAEAEVLLVTKILVAFEQQPAGLLQDRVTTFAFHETGFLRANFVECLVHIGDDVETIKDMQ